MSAAFPSKATPPLVVCDKTMSRNTLITTTKIHIMALDGIVNVNSLFTAALFLGLTWFPASTPGTTSSLVTDVSCTATSAVEEGLVSFHVYSFSSFLFSSLIALAVKQAIKIVGNRGDGFGVSNELHSELAHINLGLFRVGTLVSAFGSVFGCGFLMMALVDLVQIKLGSLACGDVHTLAAISPLMILVPSALVIYVFLTIYAFIC